jgi:hypothetical protein
VLAVVTGGDKQPSSFAMVDGKGEVLDRLSLSFLKAKARAYSEDGAKGGRNLYEAKQNEYVVQL